MLQQLANIIREQCDDWTRTKFSRRDKHDFREFFHYGLHLASTGDSSVKRSALDILDLRRKHFRTKKDMHILSPSSIYNFWNHISIGDMKNLYQKLSKTALDYTNDESDLVSPLDHQILMIDGTSFRLDASNVAGDCKKQKGQHYPHIFASVCLDYNTNIIADVVVSKKQNERSLMIENVTNTESSNQKTYVGDRGYQSADSLDLIVNRGQLFVFRGKEHGNDSQLMPFFASNKTDETIEYKTKTQIVTIRLVRYTIDQQTYTLITNHLDTPAAQLQLIYKHRWFVEESIKVLKHIQCSTMFKALDYSIIVKLVYFRLILMLLAKILEIDVIQNHIRQNHLVPTHPMDRFYDSESNQMKINSRAAFDSVTRNLCTLMYERASKHVHKHWKYRFRKKGIVFFNDHNNDLSDWINTARSDLMKTVVKIYADRSFDRKSCEPVSKHQINRHKIKHDAVSVEALDPG